MAKRGEPLLDLEVINADPTNFKAEKTINKNVRSKATHGYIIKVEDGELKLPYYYFPFNPKEVSRSRKVEWDFLNSPGTCSSIAEWVRTGDETIKFTLLLAARSSTFHASYKSELGVLPDIAEIESWAMPSLEKLIDNPFQYIPPPRLILSLGARSWNCVLEDYTIKEKLYKHDLAPIIVEVDIALRTVSGSFNDVINSAINLQQLRNNLYSFEPSIRFGG